MSKLFLSENRFTPIKLDVTARSNFYARTTKDVKVVIETIDSDAPSDPSDNVFGPDHSKYKANVLIGNKVAFSCTLLELNALAVALNQSLQNINNQL